MARTQDLLSELSAVHAGGPGIPGLTAAPTGATWDAVASADLPEVGGDAVAFVVLEDGTIVVDVDLPDGSLGPLATELEEVVSPPYRAAAVRSEGTLWTGVAESVRILALPGISGSLVELSIVQGERTVTVDGEPAAAALDALDALAREGDVAISAERVDGDLFAVDVFPL